VAADFPLQVLGKMNRKIKRQLKEVISGCLEADPANRMTANTAASTLQDLINERGW